MVPKSIVLNRDYVAKPSLRIAWGDCVALEGATGARSIPALVLDGGRAIVGEQTIREYLD